MNTQLLPTDRQLRSFGLTVGGAFVFISLWPLIRHKQDPRLWLSLIGGALVVTGMLAPAILQRPYQIWMQFAHLLGWINTRVILTIMFYAVFTPAALICRLLGKDPLTRAFLPAADTYRVRREPRSPSHMKHQF